MRIIDYSPDVRELVVTSLAVVDRLLPRFDEVRADPRTYLDEAARDLVTLLTEIYQLRRFARLGAPHIDDLGGFGTGLDDSDAPTVMSTTEGKESWDFQPWLAEKLQFTERIIFRLCDLCATGPDAPVKPYWRRVGRYEDVRTECTRLLQGARSYLNTILGLLDSGELKIHQLSAADEFEAEDEDTE